MLVCGWGEREQERAATRLMKAHQVGEIAEWNTGQTNAKELQRKNALYRSLIWWCERGLLWVVPAGGVVRTRLNMAMVRAEQDRGEDDVG